MGFADYNKNKRMGLLLEAVASVAQASSEVWVLQCYFEIFVGSQEHAHGAL